LIGRALAMAQSVIAFELLYLFREDSAKFIIDLIRVL